MMNNRRVAAVLGVCCFALYASLSARDVMWGDGLELVAAAITNGVAHPPGYPLWIVLGHLAGLLPLGTAAFRVNLTAAAYHAATVSLTYATAYALTERYAASLFAALLLAVGSPLFVIWSLQAETFSLNDLFAAGIVLTCVVWLTDPRRRGLLLVLAALFGLGLSNHQTLILLVPLAVWTAWCGRHEWLRDKRVRKTLALSALVFVVGFTVPYAHTLLVSQTLPAAQPGVAQNLAQLLDVISRREFGSFQLAASPQQQGGTFFERLAVLMWAGGWPWAFVAAGIAALALQRRYRELGAAAMLVLFPLVAFCVLANTRADDEVTSAIWARFGLLPLVALTPFSACALAWMRRPAAVIAVAILGVAGLFQALRLSLNGVDGPRAYARDVFNALPQRSMLLTAGDAADLAPGYFQHVEGWRPDVTLVADEFLGVPRDSLIDANPGRPFYTAGGYAIEKSSDKYEPYVLGVVKRMISSQTRVDVLAHYNEQRALLAAPGYGDVIADRWKSNGWGGIVRGYYASGFLSAGVNAERLGKMDDARYWYAAARAYQSDVNVQQTWEAQLRSAGLTLFEANP